MASKRLRAKKIQRSSCGNFVLISKESMEKLKLKPQDPDCLMVEIADPARGRLVYKVLRLNV